MRYYIIDDVISIVKILSRIIEQKELGQVVGLTTDAQVAVKEILETYPDIVYVDLLMPMIDGITLVKKIKNLRPQIHFIMISQVSDKDMIAEAYKCGVEFFIHKPINIIEVETVTRRVAEKIRLENMLGGIREMIQNTDDVSAVQHQNKDPLKEIKYLLGILGMIGELGTKDIMNICKRLLQDEQKYTKEVISLYSIEIGEEVTIIKQRMRRAIKKGLTNTAMLGLEDCYNDYQSYAYMVFDFDNIKLEMDHLRGKSAGGGRVNLDKFIEGLLIFNKLKD